MKLSVFSVLLQDKSFESACEFFAEKGVQAIEIGCGGYPGKAHCNPEALLNDEKKVEQLLSTLKKNNLEIAALSCHGNPVHPDKTQAGEYHKDFENTILLAEKLNVNTVVTFSGCPGGSPDDRMPNWATCSWPEEFSAVLKYQWEEVLIPYWKKELDFVRAHGVKKIALEMHPGFCVYNPETLIRLRCACGKEIGANFDPSHLFWQGIDPVAAIRYLDDAIYFFHAKDTKIDELNCAVNGVLDTKPFGDEIHRSWMFRSVGYGHAHQIWKDMMSNLRMVGYDGCISIEHEDSLMSANEGLVKAIAILKDVMVFEPLGECRGHNE